MIDGMNLNIFKIVIIFFKIIQKQKKFYFFQEIFFFINFSINIILMIQVFSLSNLKVNFLEL